jgi:retron-type reverse transcriptase
MNHLVHTFEQILLGLLIKGIRWAVYIAHILEEQYWTKHVKGEKIERSQLERKK